MQPIRPLFTKTTYLAITFLALLLTSCATVPRKAATMQRGRDFDSSKVNDIHKGKTTTEEIVQWFGQPVAKKVVSANQVGWLYDWRKSTVTVTKTSTSTKGKETGHKKRLELLIVDDVVMNYAFEEGPFETERENMGR